MVPSGKYLDDPVDEVSDGDDVISRASQNTILEPNLALVPFMVLLIQF